MDTKTQFKSIQLMKLESPEQYLILNEDGDAIIENDLSFMQKQSLWLNTPVLKE